VTALLCVQRRSSKPSNSKSLCSWSRSRSFAARPFFSSQISPTATCLRSFRSGPTGSLRACWRASVARLLRKDVAISEGVFMVPNAARKVLFNLNSLRSVCPEPDSSRNLKPYHLRADAAGAGSAVACPRSCDRTRGRGSLLFSPFWFDDPFPSRPTGVDALAHHLCGHRGTIIPAARFPDIACESPRFSVLIARSTGERKGRWDVALPCGEWSRGCIQGMASKSRGLPQALPRSQDA
jgi:hypothetical protein